MTDLTPMARISPPTPAPLALSRKQKAAIIVRFLLNEGADIPLTDLPDAMQAELTQQMGGMSYVDRDTLARVLLEFADELEGFGLAFPRDIVGALTAMDGKINPHTAARLRKEAGVRQIGDPWEQIRQLEVKRLTALVANESTEIAAVILSKLDVGKAAELLGQLPGEQARRITFAVSQTSGVTPDAVDRIGMTLAAEIAAEPARAFAEEPVKRVGAILDNTPVELREDMLSGLAETDQGFAEAVRRAMFTFADIPARTEAVDVPKIVREADPAGLQTALTAALAEGADEAVKTAGEFILDNMSRRLAEQLREDIAQSGPVKPAEGEAAMTALVGVIRQLEAAGALTLIRPEEDGD